MPKFIWKWLVNALALYVAIAFVPGIQQQGGGGWVDLLWLAAIFGLLNSLLRPILKILSCPLILLTFGLYILVINTFMFWLAGTIGNQFSIGFSVDGFGAAFLGALVVSVINLFFSGLFKDDDKKKQHDEY